MSNPCYYHPKASAVGMCVQCGTPGCADCLEAVGDKKACRRCVDALKVRLAASTAITPPFPPSGTAPRVSAGVNPNAGLNFASKPSDYVEIVPHETPQARQWLMGIVLASGVGLLGAIGIEKLMFHVHLGIALLYLLLGAAVSGVLRAFLGRGGQTMALTAAGIMIACLGVGHLIYVQDILNEARQAGDASGATFSEVFPVAMGHLTFAHWLFVLGSVMLCLLSANRE